MRSLSPSSQLWQSILPLSVKCKVTGTESPVDALFTLQMRRDSNKRLDLSITQESDAFFLYTVSISEEDFLHLKQTQGLLVDFSVFPEKLIELLSSCANTRFVAQLITDGRGSVLNLTEINSFRQIIHLSLNVVVATDAVLKKYLADMLVHMKIKVKELQSKLMAESSTNKNEVTEKSSTIKHLRNQIEEIRINHSHEIKSITNRMSEEFQDAREKLLVSIKHEKREHEKELKTVVAKFEDQISTLNNKLLVQKSENERTKEQRKMIELQLEDLKIQQSKQQTDSANQDSSLQLAKAEKAHYERECIRMQSDHSRLMEQLGTLEVKEKNYFEKINSLQLELQREHDKKLDLSAKLESSKILNDNLERELRESNLEIKKGNEIIAKISAESKIAKSKMKMRSVVTVQQEKLLEDRQLQLSESMAECDELRKKLCDLNSNYELQKSELNDLKFKMQVLEKSVEEKQEMIEWLNSQIQLDVKPVSRIPKPNKVSNFFY